MLVYLLKSGRGLDFSAGRLSPRWSFILLGRFRHFVKLLALPFHLCLLIFLRIRVHVLVVDGLAGNDFLIGYRNGIN